MNVIIKDGPASAEFWHEDLVKGTLNRPVIRC